MLEKIIPRIFKIGKIYKRIYVHMYSSQCLKNEYNNGMKLVILAAGKGTRMGKLGENTPKPILKYKGKNLIQHKLDELPVDITEIVIVIGYLGEQIIETIGDSHMNIPITYIWQKELLGTGHSLWIAKESLTDSPFIVLMGDDLYSKKDLSKMIEIHKANSSWVALLEESNVPMSTGKCVVNEKGELVAIVEDPKGESPNNIMYTGGCLLTPEVFNLPLVKLDGKEEYGLPQTFIQDERKVPIHAVKAAYWKRITEPADLD
jgi:glucose-1-phosphate thymidylyltransferase